MHPSIHIVTLGVADLERSFRFYREGLGLPTQHTPDKGIVLFTTYGARLYIYPCDKLAEDAGYATDRVRLADVFPGFSLAHAARSKEEVDDILRRAELAGGRIVKPAHTAFWGGYSGYFADPDNHHWEIAYASSYTFSPDGSLMLET